MFKELYLKADAKVEPDLKLINATKAKMREELNTKKPAIQIHLYKYATLAACFIIVTGLFWTNLRRSSNDVMQEFIKDESSSLSSDSTGELAFPSSSPSSNAFSNVTINSDSSVKEGISSNPVLSFFMKILQWFYELLF